MSWANWISVLTSRILSAPLASARSFAGVSDVKLSSDGTVYAADSGNNRVICFPPNGKTATKVWGQINFSANGVNQIKAGSINAPYKIAIDYSRSPFPLYVSDTNNHRVLIWRDATAFRTGDPADLVIGQPDLNTALPNVEARGSRTPIPDVARVAPRDCGRRGWKPLRGRFRQQSRIATSTTHQPNRTYHAGCRDWADGFRKFYFSCNQRFFVAGAGWDRDRS